MKLDETCLRSLQFIVALRWCVEDICEQHMSSLFICMVFATLETHATTTWAAFQLQIGLGSLQPHFGSNVMVYGLSTATAMYFLVWAQYSLTWSVSWRTLQSLGLIWTETPHIINGPIFFFLSFVLV